MQQQKEMNDTVIKVDKIDGGRDLHKTKRMQAFGMLRKVFEEDIISPFLSS